MFHHITLYFYIIFVCFLEPGPPPNNLQKSGRRLGMPPRNIILVIFSTFSRELFHPEAKHDNIYFYVIFACSLGPEPLLHHLKISCCRLGMPPRKIILVIYSTFSGQLFHHIKNFPSLVLITLNTKLYDPEAEPM